MQRGFTFIQLSILLTVASLVMVSLLPSLQTKLSSDNVTTAKLNADLTAMREYEAANGKLPCPADAGQPMSGANYGVAAANSGTTNNCGSGTPAADYIDSSNNIAIGMVPVRALGLSNDYALDGYGRHITYAVDTDATTCGWSSSALTGKIVVTDNGVANSSLLALVSHGSDGHGAWIPLTGTTGTAVRLNAGSTDTDQLTNAHLNSSFVATTPLTNFVRKMPTSTFDDLVVYKSALWNISMLPVNSPTLVSITPPANGDYESSQGQSLTFTVTYSTAVTVTGTPQLDLNIGGTTRYATYASGSGTTVLTFSYPIVAADYAPSPAGISMTGAVDLNGGTITSGNFCLPIGFPVPSLSSVYVNALAIYIADAGLTANVVRRVMASTGIITTVAGTGTAGYTGDGGEAAAAELNLAYSVNTDPSGNVYIADINNARIRKVTLSTGIITTVAGNGTLGYSGDGSAATSAKIYPATVAVDNSGNIYISDSFTSCTIRKVTASTGIITTIAGNGTCGLTGSNGSPATSVELGQPSVAVDSSGNVYITEHSNHIVREVIASTGNIYLFAGTGTSGYSGDGGLATSAKLAGPRGLSVDSSGNIYIADDNNNDIRKVTASTGNISTIAGNGTAGYSGDGAAAASAEINSPRMTASDSSGNVYIADYTNSRVRKVTASTGNISTLAGNGTSGSTGNGGAATSAELEAPQGVAVGIVR